MTIIEKRLSSQTSSSSIEDSKEEEEQPQIADQPNEQAKDEDIVRIDIKALEKSIIKEGGDKEVQVQQKEEGQDA